MQKSLFTKSYGDDKGMLSPDDPGTVGTIVAGHEVGYTLLHSDQLHVMQMAGMLKQVGDSIESDPTPRVIELRLGKAGD